MRSVARHEEFPVELHSSAIPNAIGGNYVPDAAIIASESNCGLAIGLE